jgi:hypothetical protein
MNIFPRFGSLENLPHRYFFLGSSLAKPSDEL